MADDKKSTESFDPEFEAKLSEFEERVRGTREAKEAEAEARRAELASSAKANRGLGYGLSIAVSVAGMPMVGYGIGLLIDQALDATLYRGLVMVLFAVAGIGFALRLIKRANEDL